MSDEVRADDLTDAGQEREHSRRAAPPRRSAAGEHGCDGRSLLGRLQDDGVAGDERGDGHPRRDGEREVPRRDDDSDTEGIVERAFSSPGGDSTGAPRSRRSIWRP